MENFFQNPTEGFEPNREQGAHEAGTHCENCGGRGLVGGPVGQTAETFDYVTEPCPDCTGDAQARAAIQTGWRPIDTAPKDGTVILLWNGGAVLGWWESGREFGPSSSPFNDWCSGHNTVGGYDAGFERVYNATHWMPLPAPPVEPA